MEAKIGEGGAEVGGPSLDLVDVGPQGVGVGLAELTDLSAKAVELAQDRLLDAAAVGVQEGAQTTQAVVEQRVESLEAAADDGGKMTGLVSAS